MLVLGVLGKRQPRKKGNFFDLFIIATGDDQGLICRRTKSDDCLGSICADRLDPRSERSIPLDDTDSKQLKKFQEVSIVSICLISAS
jgi:hypothetical protein